MAHRLNWAGGGQEFLKGPRYPYSKWWGVSQCFWAGGLSRVPYPVFGLPPAPHPTIPPRTGVISVLLPYLLDPQGKSPSRVLGCSRFKSEGLGRIPPLLGMVLSVYWALSQGKSCQLNRAYGLHVRQRMVCQGTQTCCEPEILKGRIGGISPLAVLP